jgi:hypothetical protein
MKPKMKRVPANFTMRPLIDRRERDTILAALYLWQNNKPRSGIAHAIAADFGKPLTVAEISELRNRLNIGTKMKPTP